MSEPWPTRARQAITHLSRRIHPSVLFVVGVAWDWATLSIERAFDNALLCAYLAALVAVFIASLRVEAGRRVPTFIQGRRSWLPWIEQFLLGALLSAFWVHIVRAMHPGPPLLFATALLALAVANETQGGWFRASIARAGLVTFCSFQLLSLVLPLLTRDLVWIGLPFAGSVALCLGMLALANLHVAGEAKNHDLVGDVGAPIAASVLSALALLLAIRMGVVPALPLVLQDGAIARHVEWKKGELIVDRYEVTRLQALGIGTPSVQADPKLGMSVYTKIYAPSGMSLELLHHWQRWEEVDHDWVTTDRIPLEVRGESADGWRTWSTKQNLVPGRWRIRVMTKTGQELGRVGFDIDPSATAE